MAVGVEAAGDEARLTFADTGPGIVPGDLTSVFDRLWRGSADAKSVGSGIGLAVVRELVTAHQGTVGATSDGEHGTTITVLIPRLGQAEPRTKPGTGPTSNSG